AVVSGAVARLLAARPDLQPDDVKALLRATAHALPGADALRQGAGLIDVAGALSAAVPGGSQQFKKASADRRPANAPGVEIAVENPDSSRWSSSRWSSSRWSSSRWSSSRWSSSRW